jgi:hypothetical protein
MKNEFQMKIANGYAMEKANRFCGARNAGNMILTVALLFAAGPLALRAAAAPTHSYSGLAYYSAGHAWIKLNLAFTEVNNTWEANGEFYIGPTYFPVDGKLNGGSLTGSWSRGLSSGPIYGSLQGVLGSGDISVYTVAVATNIYAPLSFTLSPVLPPTPVTGPTTSLANQFQMAGATGFGYTVVSVKISGSLTTGGVYDVNGSIVVSTIVNGVDKLSDFSIRGSLKPGVLGTLTVTGAPAADHPEYTMTLSPNATSFTSELSGIPTSGIYALYINGEL